MPAMLPFVTLLLIGCSSLHLHVRPTHTSVSTKDLTILISNANRNLSDIKSSLKSITDSLNPFNQEERINKL